MDIQGWLKTQRVSGAAYDADELLESFLSEMRKGLDGESSSLAMIPSYVHASGAVPPGQSVAVIDAGGTNLRTCLVHFDATGAARFSRFDKQPMPGTEREVGAADFYRTLADALEGMQDRFERIGFCFSYPAAILPDVDGQLIHWTKEIKIPELVGQRIGAGLRAELERRGIRGRRIVLLNDTVAALLAGVAEGRRFGASTNIGFILGTGTNIAYVERNANIRKLPGLPPEDSQVINAESGAFAAFERGPADLALDRRSENPGKHVFEKLISGVYMGPLALELLQGLAAEGALSKSGAAAFSIMKTLSTIHIDNLAANNGLDIGVLGSEAFADADRETMKTVFNAVVERAALLTAVNIASAVVKSGAGTDPARPVCVNIDGSTYYKTHRLAEQVQERLGRILGARGLHIRCIQVDDAPVVGAAIAALAGI